MKFSADSESISEITSSLVSYSDDISAAFSSFIEKVKAIAVRTNYRKLADALKGTVEIYNESICKDMRKRLIGIWTEEGESLHAFAEDMYMGEESEEAVRAVESQLDDIFLSGSEDLLYGLEFVGDPDVQKEDFDDISCCIDEFNREIENIKDRNSAFFENKIDDNEFYRFLIPIIEAIGASIISFGNDARECIESLGEKTVEKMTSQKNKAEEAKKNVKPIEFDLDLFDLDEGSSFSEVNNTSSGSNSPASTGETGGNKPDADKPESSKPKDMENTEEQPGKAKNFSEFMKKLKGMLRKLKDEDIPKLVKFLKDHPKFTSAVLSGLCGIMNTVTPGNPLTPILSSMMPEIIGAASGKVEDKKDAEKIDVGLELLEKLGIFKDDDETGAVTYVVQNPSSVISDYISANSDRLCNIGLMNASIYNEYNKINEYNRVNEYNKYNEINSMPYDPFASFKSGYTPAINDSQLSVGKYDIKNIENGLAVSAMPSGELKSDIKNCKAMIGGSDDVLVDLKNNPQISELAKTINSVTEGSGCPALLKSYDGKFNKAEISDLIGELDNKNALPDNINNYIRKRYGYPKIEPVSTALLPDPIRNSSFISDNADNSESICGELEGIIKSTPDNTYDTVRISPDSLPGKFINEMNTVAESMGIDSPLINKNGEYNRAEIEDMCMNMRRSGANSEKSLAESASSYISPKIKKFRNGLSGSMESGLDRKFDDIISDVNSGINQMGIEKSSDEYTDIPKGSPLEKTISCANRYAAASGMKVPVRKSDKGYNRNDVLRFSDYLKNNNGTYEVSNDAKYPVVNDLRELISIIDDKEKAFVINDPNIIDTIDNARRNFGNENYNSRKGSIIELLIKLGMAAVAIFSGNLPVAVISLFLGGSGESGGFEATEAASLSKLICTLGETRTDFLLGEYLRSDKIYKMINMQD